MTKTGDLTRLITEAEFGWTLSKTYCGECRAFHATRGYLRATGFRRGAENDRETLIDVVRAQSGEASSILIAGSADSGLFEVVAQATSETNPSIMVVDKCETPLHQVKALAESIGRKVETGVADLTETAPEGPFDLIFMHHLLPFIQEDRQVKLLSDLAKTLNPLGKIFLVNHVRPIHAKEKPQSEVENWSASVLKVMALNSIPVPEDKDLFFSLLMQAGQRHEHESSVRIAKPVEQVLQEAGLGIIRQWQTEAPRFAALHGGGGAPTKRSEYFLAERLAT